MSLPIRGSSCCALLAVFFLAVLAAPPAEGSCVTPICDQQRRLRERQQETELRQELLQEPDDPDNVRRLLDLLSRKVRREEEIRGYQRRYTWTAMPPVELEESVALERRYWAKVLTRIEADHPGNWCRLAERLAEPAARVELLQQRLEEQPDEPRLVTCLAHHLEELGQRADAMARLRELLDRVPDPAAFGALISLHGEDEPAVTALLEEEATRRPDSIYAQLDLLRHWLARPKEADRVKRGFTFAQTLLDGPISPSEHKQVCSTLGLYRHPEPARRCWWRLYRQPWPDAGDREDIENLRADALEALIRQALHDRDWPRVEEAFALLPEERHAQAWSQIVDFTDGEYCPQFLAAYEEGIPWREQWQGRRIANTLGDCGNAAGRRRVLAEAGLLDAEGRDMTMVPTVEDQLLLHPGYDGEALPEWRFTPSAAKLAESEMIAELLAFATENPTDHLPWIYLAGLYDGLEKGAGDRGADDERHRYVDRALGAWEAAVVRRPGDLDLLVALGAAGLQYRRQAVVRSAARRILIGDPNPRQAAEASYLLGRLALWQGRSEEASDRLVAYFLIRLRFEGYGLVRMAERALFTHLVRAGHRDRLRRYLAERPKALAEYQAGRTPPHPGLHPFQLRRDFSMPELQPPDPALLAPGAKPEQLPDPGPLFPDERLLALSWYLRTYR